MTILTNNLLFNHTYLRELTADTTIDPEIPFSPKDLSDWYSFLDTSSTKTMVDSWVRPMLSLLELDIHQLTSDDERAFELTTDYDRDTAIGVCYVAPPGADLDTTTKGLFWMAQAVLAARRHEPTLRWVILTNGDLWRLLDAQALRRYEAYVQIDVGQLAQGTSDPSALRVFFRCFHRSAFEQNDDSKSGLEKLLEISDHATEQAEKHLKERVSGTNGIMAQLCLGLVRSTGKSKFSEEERDAIYRDATTLLYRMLFLLYAESRGLLPVENPNYAAVSMRHLVDSARQGQQRGLENPQATDLWIVLKRLSNAIYESDPDLGIPAYNGGLFDDDDHPYLRDGFIANQYLSRALYDLAFLPNCNDVQSIDYRDLSVRHLGSLYEGMIEYKLFVAEEPMLARRDKKGNIHFLTQREGGGLRRIDQEIKSGEVYFAQSSGERRATGTYYTPEYIVDYIVCNTVVRGLEERREPLVEKLKTWLDEIHSADPDDRPNLQRTVDEELLKFVEQQVLTFTVCDPAMGSGHFLVNAAHNIADYIVETLCLTTWKNQYTDIDPVNWRRRVAERCLYGVDISEMAVELAKLSMWLATMAQGKPLSFLEHRLKCGNSLIGADFEDMKNLLVDASSHSMTRREQRAIQAGQLSMLDTNVFNRQIQIATHLLEKISAHVTETLSDIKSKEENLEKVRSELSPYFLCADILASKQLGLDVSAYAQYELIYSILGGMKPEFSNFEDIYSDLESLRSSKRIFHWPLEFPEIFLKNNELSESELKFNAVVGNPPYVRGRVLPTIDKSFYTQKFTSAYKSYDLYILFIELGLRLLSENGYFAMIVPRSFLTESYGEVLRKFLLDRTTIIEISDYLSVRVFEDVGIINCIPLIQKVSPLRLNGQNLQIRCVAQQQSYLINQRIFFDTPQYSYRIELTQSAAQVVEKIVMESIRVGDICYISYSIAAHSEVENKGKDAYIYSKSINQKCKPFIEGKEIKRYEINWLGRYLEYDVNILRRPSLPELFESQKITVLGISGSTGISATFDSGYFYVGYPAICCTNKCNLKHITRSDISFSEDEIKLSSKYNIFYILAVLNSRLIKFYFDKMIFSTSQTVYSGNIRNIPLRKIFEVSSSNIHSDYTNIFHELHEQFLGTSNYPIVLEYVSNELRQIPKNCHVIHDFLAYLAQYMIDINAKKFSETKEFLRWFENEVGARVTEFSGKSYLLNFLGDYQKNEPHLDLNELIDIIIKNKRKLAIDPNERGFQLSLEKRYQEILDVLLPIKKRLAMTDKLINQIVYKLYDLTDDEIAIVEG